MLDLSKHLNVHLFANLLMWSQGLFFEEDPVIRVCRGLLGINNTHETMTKIPRFVFFQEECKF